MLPAIGRVGVFSAPLEVLPRAASVEFVRELEALGYGAIWTGEGLGTREIFTNAAAILSGTERIVFCAGIANIWGRDAVTASTAASTLLDSFDGRFLLGLGVSHREQIEPRGYTYSRPVATMRAYLDAMDAVAFASPLPDGGTSPRPPRVLAALRPGMLRLAAERADGAHPYMTIPDATARAKEILGPEALLLPEQAFVLETDPSVARGVARGYLSWYLAVENYQKSLLWQGFAEEDLAGGGSDRLVDAIVAWGDEEAVRSRVQEHFDAGATHVCVQAIAEDALSFELDTYSRVAPALLG